MKEVKIVMHVRPATWASVEEDHNFESSLGRWVLKIKFKGIWVLAKW